MFPSAARILALFGVLTIACAPAPDFPSLDEEDPLFAPDAEFADATIDDLGFTDAATIAMDADVLDALEADADEPDAGFPDAIEPDAFAPDAIAPDAFAPDAEEPDVFVPDAFAPDAPAEDAFAPDAPAEDAFLPDALEPDAEAPDVLVPDAEAPDTGDLDAGFADADPPDVPSTDIGPLGPGVTTLTGSEQSGDLDGPRGVASFDNPVNVVTATGGLAYVADFYNGRVVRVTDQGFATTVYRAPSFIRPFGMALDGASSIYVQTDRNSTGGAGGALWRIDLRTNTATIVADNVGRPRALAVLGDGRLIFADYTAHVVGIIDPFTGTSTTIAGVTNTPGFADGNDDQALFDTPSDLVLTSSTTVLVADRNNHRLRLVTLDGAVTTFAGTSTAASIDGPLATAQFDQPFALGRAPNGDLYVADAGSYLIRRISGGSVSTYAGDGTAGFVDSTDPLAARFFGMEGIDVTRDGAYLLIADGTRGLFAPYHRIRRVDLP